MASIGELRKLLRQHDAKLRVSRFRALGHRRGIAYVEYHFEISLSDGRVHASYGRHLQAVLDQAEAFLAAEGIWRERLKNSA